MTNSEILDQLEAFSREDEDIRNKLNRKSKVKDLKLKSEGALKHSVVQLAQSSPNKKLKSSFRSSPERERKNVSYRWLWKLLTKSKYIGYILLNTYEYSFDICKIFYK